MKKLILKLKKIRPEFFYRLALASIFLSSGYQKLIRSTITHSFSRAPNWLNSLIISSGAEDFFRLLGLVELFLGLLLLLSFLPIKNIRQLCLVIFIYSLTMIFLNSLNTLMFVASLLALGLFFNYWRRYKN